MHYGLYFTYLSLFMGCKKNPPSTGDENTVRFNMINLSKSIKINFNGSL